MNFSKGIKFLLLTLVVVTLSSCGSRTSETSALTGWKFNDLDGGAGSNYKGQPTPPGMVLVEGGAFTMGSVQDDVLFDWNTTPNKMQVRSFYMDEAEVTNREYRLFVQWMEEVYPPNNENYKHIYESVLPDTLVWRQPLSNLEILTETYFRHPSYNDYPVVGVSWVQANMYCKWRTDMVNEKILMDKGILNPLFEQDSLKVEGKNHFDTEVYLLDPTRLFDGDSTIYKKGLPDLRAKSKKHKSSRGSRKSRSSRSSGRRGSKGGFTGRHVKVEDGMLTQKFRLPTEVEWEFAGKALVENREYNTLKGRKKFSWNGKYTRSNDKRNIGDEKANFKLSKGNYSGLPGWSDDGSDIPNRVKSYKPNALGLYDMTGNVAEWVADVYRPIIDSDASDFNYFRGNTYAKRMIDEEGKVVIIDENTIQYDTLDNGKITAKDLPGTVKYIPITKSDAFMRDNYEKSYNIDSKDGDIQSTRKFGFEEDDEEEGMDNKPRMYNSPIVPKEIGESGYRRQMYDTKVRTTLISDKTRVYKGGSWRDRAYWLDPAQRRYLPQYMATDYIGFRCATDRLGPMSDKKREAYHH
jgi:gliding motility-associated lipoprotein GldJ